jgi:outer membrane protein W
MQRAKTPAIVLLLFLFATSFLVAQATQIAELKSVKFEKRDNQIEVNIEFPRHISYDSFSLMNPNRLVLDFIGIRAVSTAPQIAINEMGILSIRSALNRPGVARVVFNFEDETPLYRLEESESGLTITFWEETRAVDERGSGSKPAPISQKTEKPSQAEMTKTKIEEEKPTMVSEDTAKNSGDYTEIKKMGLGFSAGYLTLQDSAFNDAYGEGGTFFKGEYSLILPIKIQSFDIWAGFTYFEKNGKTSITQEDIKLRMTNFSLAFRYLHKFSKFTPFAGVGIDYIAYKEILPEDFMIESVGGTDLGYHVQGGVFFDALPYLSIKAHIKYLWSKTEVEGYEINFGGVEYGAGLIFRFNL